MKIILLGPPGSGKGTVAERLCNDFSWYHLSAGEMLREEVKRGTALGKQIQKIIDTGNLVPPRLIADMVRLMVEGKSDYLLDGFPRSVVQAKMICDLAIDKVVVLEVPNEEIIERLKGRRVCALGTHSYHLVNMPPKREGVCDVDGTELISRQDDNPQVISKRFEVYEAETKPVIGYYLNERNLVKVNGGGKAEDVYERMLRAIGLKGIAAETKVKK